MSDSSTADPILLLPGSDGYDAATSPHNSVAVQKPALVVFARSDEDVMAAIAIARGRGLRLVPQATGHGAGTDLGDDALLLDTSRLDAVEIDPPRRTAVVGAGATWAVVQAAAEPHGLAGLAGSAPSVAVSGYTFGGGVGWFVRPYGTAADSLRAVDFVDGAGRLRSASDDAAEAVDRAAMRAFRGGGGVGVAVRLHLDLHPIGDLVAGYLLWPGDRLEEVVAAWADALPGLDDTVSTSIAQIQAPPGPPFPPSLQGSAVVHLAFATTGGAASAAPLLDAVRRAADPVVDTAGPSDLARLGTVHLDPPPGSPAVGDARWLTGDAVDVAAQVLATADKDPIVMTELRHVATAAPDRPSAATAAGPFIAHAVVPVPPGGDRSAAEQGLRRFRERLAPADAGRTLGSWAEGSVRVVGGLAPEALAAVRATADEVDPERVIVRSRLILEEAR